jgi:hypothetical protein
MALSLLTDVLYPRVVSLSAPIFPLPILKDGPFQTRLNQGLASVRLLLFILRAQLSLF